MMYLRQNDPDFQSALSLPNRLSLSMLIDSIIGICATPAYCRVRPAGVVNPLKVCWTSWPVCTGCSTHEASLCTSRKLLGFFASTQIIIALPVRIGLAIYSTTKQAHSQ